MALRSVVNLKQILHLILLPCVGEEWGISTLFPQQAQRSLYRSSARPSVSEFLGTSEGVIFSPHVCVGARWRKDAVVVSIKHAELWFPAKWRGGAAGPPGEGCLPCLLPWGSGPAAGCPPTARVGCWQLSSSSPGHREMPPERL